MPTPDFIVELRQKIGQDSLWLAGATAVVLRDEQVLLVRRADNGRWTPITGIVDPGEEPAVTAIRECQEETGVICAVEGLAWVKAGAEKAFPNGDRCTFLDHTFRCRWVSGEPVVNDDESSEVGWFPLDDLPPIAEELLLRIRMAVDFDGRTRFVASQDSAG
ncbi:NUDIX domain-containing protein [Kocuria coralli]|uniref:NUDIX domain-containing protein n=1 Tax=Kocuria coralli TaxID=1461025 RepID=A0A5J5KY61_9MICC|nr:NUDIX domain-containing protein [Kocuria coralli]KAA9394613.1 NUDIX domain-containing protein [Kocuria coralli]